MWERSHRLDPFGMSVGTLLFVGCYTNHSPAGIEIFGAREGGLERLGELSMVENPSFLAAHPNQTTLYAVSETVDGHGSGGRLVRLSIDSASGSLTVEQRVTSEGDAPCHLSVDAKGELLCVANYVSGSVAAYRLDPEGRIGDRAFMHQPEPTGGSGRQEGPHAHCAVPHPHRPGFVVADLGHDRITHYGPSGVVHQQLELAPGSGPRHLAWHPTLPLGFVVGELDNTLTVIACDSHTGLFDVSGVVSTLPDGFAGQSLAAEVRVSSNGARVYVSNRGHDSIATFECANDALQLISHVPSGGEGPRHFAINSQGTSMVVANQASNNVAHFRLDSATGEPIRTDRSYQMSEPVCVQFVEVPE